MAADSRRHRIDAIATFVVRAASLLVMVAIVGMLFQLVLSALPLLHSPKPQPLSASAIPVSLSDLKPAQPDWVPRQFDRVVWDSNGNERLWVALSNDRLRGGRLVQREGQWSSTNQPVAIAALPRDSRVSALHISGTLDWLVVLTQSGEYWVHNLRHGGYSTGAVPAHVSAFWSPGGRSLLLQQEHGFQVVHMVMSDGYPALLPMSSVDVGRRVMGLSISPGGDRLAVATDQPAIQIWQRTVVTPAVTLPLAVQAVDVGWFDVDTLYATGVDTSRRYWYVDPSAGSVSASQLFGRQLYEGYLRAAWMWQPKAAKEGYEAKFSLIPLLMGTLVSAVLATLMALPVAIGAAVFTGFFMAPKLRSRVKPAIELIAAFPTVVIGAVLAVWLAPRFEGLLLELLGAVVMIPTGVLLLSLMWQLNPIAYRTKRYLSQLPLVLLLIILCLIGIGVVLGSQLEAWLFDGNFAGWLYREHGIPVRQRNAVLVAIALGFAIIPTLFSLAEDAINAVPRSVAAGSLALGATHWQSFRDVVLPMAFPGIIAAIMLGFGRACGETMILLLLSGNAPLSEGALFEGVRSIAATLAMELPEASVAGSHYRVLFFAALLLFAITFVFNTAAQLFKRRLRALEVSTL